MKRWERLHNNGWSAIVSCTDDGLYSANAYDRTHPSPSWASRSVIALGYAKQIADGRVAAHLCDCPEWKEVQGAR